MTDKKIRIILDSQSAKKNADQLNKSVEGVGRSADTAAFAMKSLAAAITGVISTQKIIEYADAWTNVQNQLRRTTETQEQLIGTSSELLKIANDTRSSLEVTADLYTSLSVSTQTLVLSQERVIGVTKTINNLFLEAGKGAAETAGAVRQLGQALESGALRGDEFNSVAEGAPGILRAIQKQTGLTRAELRDLAAQGGITAELIVTSLETYSDAAQTAANKTKTSFQQSSEIARNNAIAFVGASNAITEAVALAGSAIVGLSENINTLLEIAGAAAALYIARLIPSVISYGVATLNATRAQLTAVPAVTGLSAALGVQARAATASTIAMNGMAATAGVLRGALAFLGGPLGVAFLAASALLYFGSSAEKVTPPIDQLTSSVEGLTNAQRELRKLEINKAFDEQVRVIEDANKKIKFLNDSLKRGSISSSEGIKVANDQLVIQKARLDDARQSAEKLVSALGKIVAPSVVPKDKKETKTPDASGTEKINADVIDLSGAREIAQAQSVTQTLKNELELRRQISDIYREQQLSSEESFYNQQLAVIKAKEAEELAILEAKNADDAVRRNDAFRAALENDKLQDEERRLLKAEQDAQILLQDQITEEQRTAILEQGKRAREELEKAEMKARLDNAAALGNALMSLGQGQSKKIFKIGQTLALAQAAVSLPAAVLESFKNGGGYPWGLIPAGAMLATGIKNIQQIKSAGAGLGGGGGSVPIPSLGSGSGGGTPSIPTNVNTQQIEQKRIYEIRGVSGNDKITVDQFRELMEQDGAVVVLSDSVNDASRRNVVGVTAR